MKSSDKTIARITLGMPTARPQQPRKSLLAIAVKKMKGLLRG